MFNISYVCRHVVCDIYGGKFFASSHEPNCFHDPLKEYVNRSKKLYSSAKIVHQIMIHAASPTNLCTVAGRSQTTEPRCPADPCRKNRGSFPSPVRAE